MWPLLSFPNLLAYSVQHFHSIVFSTSFVPFHTLHGVLKARILKWLPSPMDHILSELSTMTRPSWMALHGMAHNFIELDKAVVKTRLE